MPMPNQQGTNNHNWKGGKTTRVCPTCNKEFSKWPSIKQIYCSSKCRIRTGDKNPKWRGGHLINGGYKYIYSPQHPNATQMGYVLEHRLVMEEIIGRLLESDELVHHLNHNKQDNRPENLHLCTNSEHSKTHMKTRKRDSLGRLMPCPICKEITY